MLTVRVRPPPVPVMVMTAAPGVAVLDAVRVSVLSVPVVAGGAKVAVTPAGNPVAPRTTLLGKPSMRMMVIAANAVAPCSRVRPTGTVDSAKSPGGVTTVKAIVVVRVRPPPVPVTVIVAAPRLAVAAAVKVTMVLLPVVETGSNAAVTPAGRPAALKATAPVKPFVRVMVTVLVADAPGSSVTLAGSAASEHFGAGFTVRAIAVVRVGGRRYR